MRIVRRCAGGVGGVLHLVTKRQVRTGLMHNSGAFNQAALVCPQRRPNSRMAFSFKIKGMTFSLNPASAKSAIQRSGVISG